MIRLRIPLIVMSAVVLSSCSGWGVVTGAAAVTGVSAAQEGGIKTAATDTWIELQINEAWFQYDFEAFQKLKTTVEQGRVLITGVVQNPDQRVEAVRLAWQVEGVKQVINEIQIAESEGLKGYLRDTWITSRLRGAITVDRAIQSINYSIDTVQGVVYLMGVAQDQAELNHLIEKARTVSGVKQVVSYVKLAGEPIDRGNEPALTGDPPQTLVPPSSDPIDVPPTQTEPSIEEQYYNS